MAKVVQLSDAVAQLRRWLAALEACSVGQSYSIGGRTLTRQDVDTVIRPEIQRWHVTVTALEADGAGKSRPLGAQAVFPAPGAGAGRGIIPTDVWTDGRT